VQELGGVADAKLTQIHGTVLPTLVNAHTHLDLSGVGIKPAKNSFVQWIEEDVLPIRRESDTIAIQSAVNRGVALTLEGGTSIVGDIAGSTCAAESVMASPLLGTAFVEILGQGTREQAAIECIQRIPTSMGVQPHAPYSCSRAVYVSAFASGLPVATHLSETREELLCTMEQEGSLVDLAKRLNVWDESIERWNSHPVDAMIEFAGQEPLLAAHLNYIEDRHLDMLANSNITVVYCPRASAYFGHSNHRWKGMLDAGVNVALGTDSLLCLDTPDRISVIDEMRYLYSTQQADPQELFTMATVNGAIGLGIDPELVTMSTGTTAGLISIKEVRSNNPLADMLDSTVMPTWIVKPSTSLLSERKKCS
jgi:cytosine/adenosine deaminase-related metal-dependent hydrolase